MKAAPPTLERPLDGRIAQASTHREIILLTRLAWAGTPTTRAPSSGCGDHDLVGDGDDAVEACHVVECRVAFELEFD